MNTRIIDGLAILATLAVGWSHWRMFRSWWRGLNAHRAGLPDGGLTRLRRRSLPPVAHGGDQRDPPTRRSVPLDGREK